MRGKSKPILFGASTLILASFATPGLAAPISAASVAPAASGDGQAGSDGIQDIIVTAERREASTQKTPIAISAIDGGTLRGKGIGTVEGLTSQLPNVSFGRYGGVTAIFIRGIGIDSSNVGGDPRVAVYTDGVVHARSQAALLGFYDIKRVEVLAGPQGTLYGRNATAGAINFITADPTQNLEGFGTLTVGNYSTVRTEGAIGGGLSDTLTARLAFQTADRSGYGRNISSGNDIDDERTRAVRGKIGIEISPSVSALLSAHYYLQNDNGGGFHYLANTPGQVATGIRFGFAKPDDPRDLAGVDPKQRLESYGTSAKIVANLGSTELTWLSAYEKIRQDLRLAIDITTANFPPQFLLEESDQYSQEVRLSRKIGIAQLLVGGYYFYEKVNAATAVPFAQLFFGGTNPSVIRGNLFGGGQKTEAFAVFTHNTFNITDKLGIDLGVRYSKETRKVSEYTQLDRVTPYDPAAPRNVPNPAIARFANQSASWSSVDPRIAAHYQLSSQIYLYASYSKGFKSGGFNLGDLQPAFNPEKINAYEAGVKADLFDRRLRVNLSAFKYDYSNLQVTLVEGLRKITRNAAQARLHGIEAQIIALPVDDLRIDLSAAWLKSEYQNYITGNPAFPSIPPSDRSGNQLSFAPKYKMNGTVAYTIHSGSDEITPSVSALWVSRTYFTPFEQKLVSQPSRTQVDASINYKLGETGWNATAFVKNLTNDLYVLRSSTSSGILGFTILGQLGAPRTYGLTITKRF